MSGQDVLDDDEFISQSGQSEEEENLQRDLDQDDDINDLEGDSNYNDQMIKKDIMISLQRFGSIKRIMKDGMEIQAYIKGKHCEDSIKILCKLLKNQRSEWPTARLTLAKYNIIESDLLDLLLTQIQDKKLSFWIVALMSMLTMPPSQSMGLAEDDREVILKANREYKRSFLRRECLNTLIVHLSDILKGVEMANAHQQMFEATLILIRNLLEVDNGEQQLLHEYFLMNIIREDVMDMILYVLQARSNKIVGKLSLVMMQIVHHSFCCFEPQKMWTQSIQIKISSSQLRRQKFSNVPVRSSRFNPMFYKQSNIGIREIFHSLDKPFHNNPKPNQRLRPHRTLGNKKVRSIQRPYVSEDILMISIDNNKQTMKQQLTKYCIEFMETCICRLITNVGLFDLIYRDDIRVFDSHKIQYMIICSWAIEMTMMKYHKRQKEANTPQQKGSLTVGVEDIASIMQLNHFQLIYKTMFKEITREKKKDFKINVYHSCLIVFKSYLLILKEMSTSFAMDDRRNANALLANLFRHDVSKVLKKGFFSTLHIEILEKLIVVNYLFFSLMSAYAGGKVLAANTSKILKKKKKKGKKLRQDCEGQEEVEQEEEEQDNHPVFQQRKYNEKSEFSYLAEYAVIKRYVTFLEKERYKTNSKQLNTAILFFLDKIDTLLNSNWLFFQADTLIIFQQILADRSFVLRNAKEIQFIMRAADAFSKLVQSNPMALVESLFRYPSLDVKNQILNNYDSNGVNNDNIEDINLDRDSD